ncbi:MAG: hypothetical protein H0X39_06225 [Actinobacteria bacterium]|nr:hypothetical protein [Actinomycetota bacterium]
MLCKFKRVRVLGVGHYDFNGAKYYYLDLHDPNGRDTPSVRFSVTAEIPGDELVRLGEQVDGDQVVRLDLDCEISSETKVIKGTDRNVVRHKVQVQHFQAAEQLQAVAEFPAVENVA